MSTTSTSTITNTRTKTAVFLTDVVLGSVADILAELRIDLTHLYKDWDQDEAAICAWIDEQSLEGVILECIQPGGRVAPIFEFPVTYRTSGVGDATFVESRASLARYRAKLDRVPSGTTFRLVCTFRSTHSPQSGWHSTTRASTAGLKSLSFGTIGQAPDATASMRYWR
jgi:hypothetical protein